MATIRAVGGTESLSLSNSWKDYFLCCFVRTNRSGQRVVNRSPSGPPSGGITDYGSRKSEYVQVIHRSPADDEYSDCDESRGNIGREGERQNSRADDTFSSLPTESRERPKITITTDNSLTSAADSNDSSSRRFVKSKQDGQGSYLQNDVISILRCARQSKCHHHFYLNDLTSVVAQQFF